MSVYTTYDEKRDELKLELLRCLKLSKELVIGEDIRGYDDVREGYAMEVYLAIKEAIDKI